MTPVQNIQLTSGNLKILSSNFPKITITGVYLPDGVLEVGDPISSVYNLNTATIKYEVPVTPIYEITAGSPLDYVPTYYQPYSYYTNGYITVDGNILKVNMTVDSTGIITSVNSDWEWGVPDKKSIFKEKLKSNLLILNRKRKTLSNIIPPQEIKARNTLRDLISEADWRRYITNGFIMHKGDSGKWYQIFNDQKRTNVYWKGKLIETLCLHTDNCPPTDHILNIMTLIDFDENNLGKLGNLRIV